MYWEAIVPSVVQANDCLLCRLLILELQAQPSIFVHSALQVNSKSRLYVLAVQGDICRAPARLSQTFISSIDPYCAGVGEEETNLELR